METHPDILSSTSRQFAAEVTRQMWPYSSPVNLPYGHLGQVLQWCQSCCQDDWRWSMHSASSSQIWDYEFYFRDGRDALAFQLRWPTN